MRRLLRVLRGSSLALLAVSVAYFGAVRAGLAPPRGSLLSLAAVWLCAWLLFELGYAVAGRIRGRLGTIALVGRVLLFSGGLLVLAGGLANHLLRLQGYVVLVEGDAAPFFHGAHVQEFDAGFLSDPMEMDLVLHLFEVELREVGTKGAFVPVSHLVLARGGREPHAFEIAPDSAGTDGPLRFHQGAFGYGAHLVISKGEQSLFDQNVPFTTKREKQGRQVSFIVEFTVAEHDLNVRGEILLDGRARVRGHPRLEVLVAKGGVTLGGGILGLGDFANLADGHRIGFAGLNKWAEIDISRRTYPEPMLAGAWVAGLGLAVLAAGAVVRRVRA